MEPRTVNMPGGPGARQPLDRQKVIDAALRFIDDRGLQGLTMRGLGQHLGVEAMALYRYVSGREDLLEAVTQHLLNDVQEHLDHTLTSTWQGFLQALAHEIRRIALDHPAAFPLVATRHPATPWLRPPLRSPQLVETFLTTLAEHGLDDDRLAHIYRAFTSLLLGHLLLESTARGAQTGPAEEPLDEGEAVLPNKDGQSDLGHTPTLYRMRALLSQDRSQEEFEAALETLLDRLERSLSQ